MWRGGNAEPKQIFIVWWNTFTLFAFGSRHYISGFVPEQVVEGYLYWAKRSQLWVTHWLTGVFHKQQHNKPTKLAVIETQTFAFAISTRMIEWIVSKLYLLEDKNEITTVILRPVFHQRSHTMLVQLEIWFPCFMSLDQRKYLMRLTMKDISSWHENQIALHRYSSFHFFNTSGPSPMTEWGGFIYPFGHVISLSVSFDARNTSKIWRGGNSEALNLWRKPFKLTECCIWSYWDEGKKVTGLRLFEHTDMKEVIYASILERASVIDFYSELEKAADCDVTDT